MARTLAKKRTRAQYTPEYRAEALKLAERIGVAAAELGHAESQLYGWRTKARAAAGQTEAEREQAAEILKLKRQVAEQAEELAILQRRRRTSLVSRSEVRLHGSPPRRVLDHGYGPCAVCFTIGLLRPKPACTVQSDAAAVRCGRRG